MKKYEVAVFIGRFQPFHKGHQYVIDEGLKIANKVIVLVGSSYVSRTIKNPFNYQERKEMIKSVYNTDDVIVEPLVDIPYDDDLWAANIEEIVKQYSNNDIVLIGHSKDQSSYYLKMFPNWDSVEIDNLNNINATDIRKELFEHTFTDDYLNNMLDDKIVKTLKNIIDSDIWSNLTQEYHMIKKYKESWSSSPFPPVFVTVDMVLECKYDNEYYVLLIKRKELPGKNMWAVPGGFLDQQETLKEAAYRELYEETNICLDNLPKFFKNSFVFDSPSRGSRGRTITHAFNYTLNNVDKLPEVKGGDDAIEAKWVKISDIDTEMLFEDHAHILHHFLNLDFYRRSM